MNEASVRLEVYHSLQGYGYWPLHGRDAILCPRCGCKILPAVAGRPDILVLAPVGAMSVIEVKIVDLAKSKSFAFSQLEDDQRRWINAWVDQAHGLGYLAIGTINERSRRTWVIPWSMWIDLERRLIEQGHKNVPVALDLYKGRNYTRPGTSIADNFNAYYQMVHVVGKKDSEDRWEKSHWEFKPGHPLTLEREKLWKGT